MIEARTEDDPRGSARRAVAVAGVCAALLAAAGTLLWARLGGAVFSDYVLTGLAWCL
ncbi:MAG TPA: hypothetical protein VEA41_20485 [Salinarimonas sp.]|nr:hypothetical protein [Salinarimonas sp.]